MVLTLRPVPNQTLRDSLNKLRSFFRALRQTDQWKARVIGGAYVVEVTYNSEAHTWHPHLHILYSGYYYEQRLLAGQWEDITQGSPVVWISRATREHAGQLSKYCSKPADFHRWATPEVVEYAIATQGLRMVQTIGTFHDLQLDDSDKPTGHLPSVHFISLHDLRNATARGHPAAKLMLGQICDRYVALRGLAAGLLDLPPPESPMIPRDDTDQWDRAISHTAKFIKELCHDVPPRRKKSAAANA